MHQEMLEHFECNIVTTRQKTIVKKFSWRSGAKSNTETHPVIPGLPFKTNDKIGGRPVNAHAWNAGGLEFKAQIEQFLNSLANDSPLL